MVSRVILAALRSWATLREILSLESLHQPGLQELPRVSYTLKVSIRGVGSADFGQSKTGGMR